jgi:hypothetical protein
MSREARQGEGSHTPGWFDAGPHPWRFAPSLSQRERAGKKFMRKLRVGILGATGTVGQRMIQLLEKHPWFEVSDVCASDRSTGKNYAQVTKWMLETPIPEAVAKMTVQSCQPGLQCDFTLSGLPTEIAEDTELQLAKAGMPVIRIPITWKRFRLRNRGSAAAASSLQIRTVR